VVLATEGFLVANLVAQQSNENFLAAVVPAQVIALTNTQRANYDVGQLTENTLLDRAAQAKAQDMASKNYFSHTSPDGTTPWEFITQAGYQYQYAGENLAVRFVNSQDVVNAWMASPTHRANIVKPVYTQIGVGTALGTYDGEPATYVVQYFATPAAAVSAAAAPLAPASSFMSSLSRGFVRALSNPQTTANWILGIVATVMLLLLLSTFFVHVQMQHPQMLMSAAVVAFLAFGFLALNAHLIGSVVDPQAAAVGYSLFP